MNKASDIEICIDRMIESPCIYQKKLDIYEKRKLFRKENQHFELNRRRYNYKHSVPKEEMIKYWNSK